jgi:hypothetical protein
MNFLEIADAKKFLKFEYLKYSKFKMYLSLTPQKKQQMTGGCTVDALLMSMARLSLWQKKNYGISKNLQLRNESRYDDIGTCSEI